MSANSSGPPVLTVEALKKGFPTKKGPMQAVRGVSFTIQRGEVFALLGPNGAGKTTTIKMIARLIIPDEGKIHVAGRDTSLEPTETMRRLGAVLEGNRNVYWRLTARENLLYFAALHQVPRKKAAAKADELLELMDLKKKRDSLVQTLSRGMQQKVAIACALVHEPELLLLDEPTLGLDVEASDRILEWVRQVSRAGTGILLTTHQMDLAEALADRVGIMREGQIIREGRTAELLAAYERGSYQIELAAALGAEKRAALTELGVQVLVEESARTVLQIENLTSERLYATLRILEPLPLVTVNKQRTQLVDVFRRLTGS
jgi:ABC-2 type transport system ATP-binding protein